MTCPHRVYSALASNPVVDPIDGVLTLALPIREPAGTLYLLKNCSIRRLDGGGLLSLLHLSVRGHRGTRLTFRST